MDLFIYLFTASCQAVITTWFFPIMQKKETRPKYIEAIIVTIPLHANPINALFNVQLKFSTTDIRKGRDSSDKLLAAIV